MRKLIQHLMNEYKDWLYWDLYDGKSQFRLIRFTWALSKHWSRMIPCKVKGHQFEEHGTCGPDSGYIEVVCARCGYCAGHHTLY